MFCLYDLTYGLCLLSLTDYYVRRLNNRQLHGSKLFFLLASTPLIFGQDNKRTPLNINKHYRMFQYEKDIETL